MTAIVLKLGRGSGDLVPMVKRAAFKKAVQPIVEKYRKEFGSQLLAHLSA